MGARVNRYHSMKSPAGRVVFLAMTALPLLCSAPVLAQTVPSFHLTAEGPATGALTLRLDWPKATTVEWSLSGTELVLRSSQPLGEGEFDSLVTGHPDWISAAARGYDSVLLVLARPATAEVVTRGAETTIRLTAIAVPPPAAEPPPPVTEADRLADDLLRARVYVDTGRLSEARPLLRGLFDRHPDNADVAALLATVEELTGRPDRAFALTARALDNRALENRDAADPGLLRNRQRLRQSARPVLQAGLQLVDVRNGDIQHQYTVDLAPVRVGDVTLSLGAESRFVASNSYTNRQGDAVPFRQRLDRLTAEASVPLEIEGLSGVTHGLVSVDGVRDGAVGLGVGLERRWTGETLTLRAYYNQPQWDAIEMLAENGTRDRLAMTWERTLSDTVTLTLGASGNAYSLEDDSGLVKTVGVQAGLSYRVPLPLPLGTLSLDYGIDGEYVGEAEKRLDPAGNPFRPLGVTTRETHTGLATWTFDWRSGLSTAVYGGYSLDRYNADGPQVGARMQVPVGPDLAVTAGAQRTMVDSRGAGRATDTLFMTVSTRF